MEPEAELEKNVVEAQKMFPDAPTYMIQNVACNGQWNGDRLPWNRRKRRAIEKGKFVALHLYSGDDEKTWKQLERLASGTEVIQVPKRDRGPRPLRGRYGQLRFGLPGLNHSEQNTVNNGSVLWLRTLKLIKQAKQANERATVMLEQPEDPLQHPEDDEQVHQEIRDMDSSPSSNGKTLGMVKECNLTVVGVEQGA
eukprot:s909_g4.t1